MRFRFVKLFHLSHVYCVTVKVNVKLRDFVKPETRWHQNSCFEACREKKIFFFPGITLSE